MLQDVRSTRSSVGQAARYRGIEGRLGESEGIGSVWEVVAMH